MLGLLAKAGRALVPAARKLTGAALNVPGVRAVVKATPLGATALGLGSMFMGGEKSPGQLPMLPGLGNSPIPMGDRSIFRNDPNVIKALEQFAIPKAALKPSFRAPKGFVVLRDQVGDPFGLPKVVAKMFGLWKAPHKPPISVGDWQAVKRADRTVKKVRKIMTTMTRVDKAVGKGGKIKIAGKKGGR